MRSHISIKCIHGYIATGTTLTSCDISLYDLVFISKRSYELQYVTYMEAAMQGITIIILADKHGVRLRLLYIGCSNDTAPETAARRLESENE